MVARGRAKLAEDAIVGGIGEQHRLVGVLRGIVENGALHRLEAIHGVQVELNERQRAHEDVHVGFVEARHHGCAIRVDHLGRGAGQRHDLVVRPDREDAVAGDGDGFGFRRRLVHGEHAGVADDEVCGLRHVVGPGKNREVAVQALMRLSARKKAKLSCLSSSSSGFGWDDSLTITVSVDGST